MRDEDGGGEGQHEDSGKFMKGRRRHADSSEHGLLDTVKPVPDRTAFRKVPCNFINRERNRCPALVLSTSGEGSRHAGYRHC